MVPPNHLLLQHLFLLVIVCSIVASSSSLSCPCIAPHYETLMDLYDATNGTYWSTQTGWGYIAQCWSGITCGGASNSDVIQLDLKMNQLSGTLPASLAQLASLEYLDLSSNKLVGSLPEAWSQLTALRFLYLSSNYLYGVFPTPWAAAVATNSSSSNSSNASSSSSGMVNIRIMSLNNNCLFGALPLSITFGSAFPSLTRLDLCNTKLKGGRSLMACTGSTSNSNRWPTACDLLPAPPRTLTKSRRQEVSGGSFTISSTVSQSYSTSCPSRLTVQFPSPSSSWSDSSYVARMCRFSATRTWCSRAVPLALLGLMNNNSGSSSSNTSRGSDEVVVTDNYNDESSNSWTLMLASSMLLFIPAPSSSPSSASSFDSSSGSDDTENVIGGRLTVMFPFISSVGWALTSTSTDVSVSVARSTNATAQGTGGSNTSSLDNIQRGNITYTMPYSPTYSNITVFTLIATCLDSEPSPMAPTIRVEIHWPPPPTRSSVSSGANVAASLGSGLSMMAGGGSSASTTAILALLQCTKDPPVTTATYFVSLFFQLGPVAVAMGNVMLILVAFVVHATLVLALMKYRTSSAATGASSTREGGEEGRSSKSSSSGKKKSKRKKFKRRQTDDGIIDNPKDDEVPWADLWLPYMSKLRFPAVTINVMSLLIPGCFLGVTAGILNRNSTGDVVTCVIALLCTIGLIVAQWGLQRHVVLPRVEFMPYRSFAVGSVVEQKLMFPKGRWEPASMHHAFNPLLSPMKQKFVRVFTTLDLVLSCVIGVVSGAYIGGVCESPLLAMASALHLLYSAALVGLRPHRMPTDRVLCPVIHCLLGTICALRYIDLNSETSDVLQIVVSSLQGLAGLCNAYVAIFREGKLRRGDALRTFNLTEEEEYGLQRHHKTDPDGDDRYDPFIASSNNKMESEELEEIVTKDNDTSRPNAQEEDVHDDCIPTGGDTSADEEVNALDSVLLLSSSQEAQDSFITQVPLRDSQNHTVVNGRTADAATHLLLDDDDDDGLGHPQQHSYHDVAPDALTGIQLQDL